MLDAKPSEVVVSFSDDICKDDFRPEHLTILACFIEFCRKTGCAVNLKSSSSIREFLDGELGLTQYWNKNEAYVPPANTDYLNLWKVETEKIEDHAKRVGAYFKSTKFRHKDLSPLSTCLLELYYNIIDHSECDNIAYSFVEYQREKDKVNIAVCDFGRGIAKSVQTVVPQLSDIDAVRKAIEPNFTIKSTSHNKGWGLHNVVGCCSNPDSIWIISNGVALITDGENERTTRLKTPFDGTLIMCSISLDHLPDEEINEGITDLSLI